MVPRRRQEAGEDSTWERVRFGGGWDSREVKQEETGIQGRSGPGRSQDSKEVEQQEARIQGRTAPG